MMPTSGVPSGQERRLVTCSCGAQIPVPPNTLRIVCPACGDTVQTSVPPSNFQR